MPSEDRRGLHPPELELQTDERELLDMGAPNLHKRTTCS